MPEAATNVVSIGRSVVGSERKSQMLDHLASKFDAYVEAYGHEPDFFLNYMTAPRDVGGAFGYITFGESEQMVEAVFCKSVANIQYELNSMIGG